jgi:hypothetical protein
MRAVSTAASAARHVTGVTAQALLIAAIIAAIALALSPLYQPANWAIGTDSAAAARPDRSTASLEATPHQVGRGQSFAVNGTGYQTGKTTWVKVETATSIGYYSASVDAAGNLSVGLELWEAGRASLTALQTNSKGRWTVMASCWVEVEE